MLVTSIIGAIIGLPLILSGLRGLRKAPNFPRWKALDFSAIGRKGARKRREREKLRYHLVAVNTAIEGMERYWTPGPDMPMPAIYRTMLHKRACIESVLY